MGKLRTTEQIGALTPDKDEDAYNDDGDDSRSYAGTATTFSATTTTTTTAATTSLDERDSHATFAIPMVNEVARTPRKSRIWKVFSTIQQANKKKLTELQAKTEENHSGKPH